MKILISFILFICINMSLLAQDNFNNARADAYFNLLDKHNKFMGAVKVTKDGENLYSNAIGYASVTDSIKNNVDTKFRIGSISKTFTATIIYQLIEAGKLSLDTKLSTYFPKIKHSEEITIKELLNHRSGIYNFTTSPAFPYMMYNETSHEDLLELIYNLEPAFYPNDKSEYSNTNYVLLSYIIEEIEGQDYAKSLQSRIAEPLGLKNTYYGKEIEIANNEASSFQYVSSWSKLDDSHLSIPSGAGAIVSTVSDLTIFINSLLTTEKLITSTSLDQMKTTIDHFGHGLFKVPFYEDSGFGHGGSIDGFKSELYYFPASKIAVSILSNGLALNLNDVLVTILNIAYNKDVELPDFSEFNISSELLSQYEGTFSSPSFPLKITISSDGNSLKAQATGQGAFPLTAKSKTQFEFSGAGIKIMFDKLEEGIYKEFTFTQAGQQFTLTRED
ncbi:serine hydrolase domain-containing protein [Croceibacter atlanticus]|uniref:serine hydrolase domain-containing protein n=1 Tax=Croceibacter atlanticus TaxID=313588 RepID=UPI002E1361AA|nr:serine hydrolase domain-containing protein [Croceibacter atlanticus]